MEILKKMYIIVLYLEAIRPSKTGKDDFSANTKKNDCGSQKDQH